MFRARRGRAVWHFCTNCPSWPWAHETSVWPPFSRWCRTCILMLEADTGEVEWPHDDSFRALEDACECGLITIRHRA